MSRKNGVVGGIRSTFWRRVAIITIAVPMFIVGIAPTYLRFLPETILNALGNAWAEFAATFSDTYHAPNHLLVHSTKTVWASDWKPVD